jgi:Ca2+-binding RTX toxin-like protein
MVGRQLKVEMADVLTGSTSNAVGKIDILTGGVGADLFVLGDANTVFYDDRNSATAGRSDYALITDFNKSNDFKGLEDVIQLNGTREDYVLAASPTGLPTVQRYIATSLLGNQMN